MKTILLFSSFAFSAAVFASPGVMTPVPIQPGVPGNCVGFVKAIPGDTCVFLAQKNGLDVDALLRLNPQIGGLQNCPQSIMADYWYCANTAAAPAAPVPTPRPTDSPVKPPVTSNIPPPPKTNPLPPPVTTQPPPPPPPPPTCAKDNDCWRAFRVAPERIQPSYSSWCSWIITQPPSGVGYDNVPGIPNMVQKQCSKLGPATDVVPSYCRCYTDGQITGSARPTRNAA